METKETNQEPEQTACARAYLNADRVHHAGMLALLNRPETRIAYAESDGVVLHFSDWLNLVSVRDGAAAKAVLPFLTDADVLLHQPYLEKELEARGLRRELTCHPCLYEKETPVPLTLPEGVEIRYLQASDAPFVHAHYRNGENELSYLADCIRRGMLGLYEHGALAGFIGMHDEEEMGLLEILPAYRRKGYAYLLEARLINDLLAAGRMAHCEVELNNEASFALQRKLGLTVGTGIVTWYCRD